MTIYKEINLHFEDCRFEMEANTESDLVILRLNDFVKNEEDSSPSNEVYKVGNKIEVYSNFDEVKALIKALQEILPEEDET